VTTNDDPDDDLPDLSPDAHDCDDDLSCWTEDDLPEEPRGEHRLSGPLDALATACEALQTWSSDLASRLSREGAGAQPTPEELGEGRRLAVEVQEALEEALVRAVWET